ncbi:pirin family protein [Streptomonospora wellingtoniae]|uniref:Pirin family protein n=1 Tax=Streptomonospora wellingtoniae TaxID=3075544 RepID=A0ABU2KYB5_9ACTN|nr:pirin family protein [Streptomonospora sp. DSM 45055]MDT0304296.1 pirin family protein [Streptomonospora sp. DSM 45055]
MSNLEAAPREVACSSPAASDADDLPLVRVLEPRAVPLGGPRAMRVRRTLPQRAQSLIGAWCFVDHYGPDDVSANVGMRVPGHPHTGLQTVSWLFSGEVEHRDTTGVHAIVRPGEVNLMTAGSGIAHSEYSTPQATVLHGAQLWVALPDPHRFTAPGFEHYAPPPVEQDGARALVFLGSLLGHTSPVPAFSPLVGAEITLRPGQRLELEVDPAFEHGVLVDTGALSVAGTAAASGQLAYRPPGDDTLSLHASDRGAARVLLLGGRPLDERIVMWWNFVGRTHEEIVAFREQWQSERADDGAASDGSGRPGRPGRFGPFPEQWETTLAAPELPNARLRPRE